MPRRAIVVGWEELNAEVLAELFGGGVEIEGEVLVAQPKIGRLGVEFIETHGQLVGNALGVSRPVVGAAGEKRSPRRKDVSRVAHEIDREHLNAGLSK